MKTLEKMTSSPAGEVFHIYTLSRVFRLNAPRWEPILQELAENREIMRSVYAPLRLAFNAELVNSGSGRFVLESALASMANTPSLVSVKETSRETFEVSRKLVMPAIDSLKEDFVTGRVSALQFELGDHRLQGAFHSKVQLKTNEIRYVYLHPSKSWSENQKESFVELLAVMGEQNFGCSREEIWFVDLQNLEIRQPRKVFKAIRKEIVLTLNHLARMRTI